MRPLTFLINGTALFRRKIGAVSQLSSGDEKRVKERCHSAVTFVEPAAALFKG